MKMMVTGQMLNGKPVALLWKEPFLADITTAVKPGDNHLEIAVTSLLGPVNLITTVHCVIN